MVETLQRRSYDVRIGKRGTIVIPAELRRELSFEEGDTLALVLTNDGTLTARRVPSDPGERLRAALSHAFRGIDPVAYQRSIRDEDDE